MKTFFDKIFLNKKAKFKFEIEEVYEAGIVLQGWEFSSIIKTGFLNLDNSHIIIKDGEMFILNMIVEQQESTSTHVAAKIDRTRKLLLHKKEIMQMVGKVQKVGYTIVPIKAYLKKNKLKIQIALAKGKSEFDKRQSLKQEGIKKEEQAMFKEKIRGLN